MLYSPPVAYLITFSCFGTHLHGAEAGSIRRANNGFGAPTAEPEEEEEDFWRSHLSQAPYTLDLPRSRAVLEGLLADRNRQWTLVCAHFRRTHVHVVAASALQPPERIMVQLKARASRTLNALQMDPPGQRRWTRHGSTKYLWTQADLLAAVRYVIEEQGPPMVAYVNPAVCPLA